MCKHECISVHVYLLMKSNFLVLGGRGAIQEICFLFCRNCHKGVSKVKKPNQIKLWCAVRLFPICWAKGRKKTRGENYGRRKVASKRVEEEKKTKTGRKSFEGMEPAPRTCGVYNVEERGLQHWRKAAKQGRHRRPHEMSSSPTRESYYSRRRRNSDWRMPKDKWLCFNFGDVMPTSTVDVELRSVDLLEHWTPFGNAALFLTLFLTMLFILLFT